MPYFKAEWSWQWRRAEADVRYQLAGTGWSDTRLGPFLKELYVLDKRHGLWVTPYPIGTALTETWSDRFPQSQPSTHGSFGIEVS